MLRLRGREGGGRRRRWRQHHLAHHNLLTAHLARHDLLGAHHAHRTRSVREPPAVSMVEISSDWDTMWSFTLSRVMSPDASEVVVSLCVSFSIPSSPRDLRKKKVLSLINRTKNEICSRFGSEKGTVASGTGIFIFWIQILLMDSQKKCKICF
jgi:hypothetical protein